MLAPARLLRLLVRALVVKRPQRATYACANMTRRSAHPGGWRPQGRAGARGHHLHGGHAVTQSAVARQTRSRGRGDGLEFSGILRRVYSPRSLTRNVLSRPRPSRSLRGLPGSPARVSWTACDSALDATPSRKCRTDPSSRWADSGGGSFLGTSCSQRRSTEWAYGRCRLLW
eukprot:3886797-Prymnesium_polylepis.1